MLCEKDFCGQYNMETYELTEIGHNKVYCYEDVEKNITTGVKKFEMW